MLGLKGAGLVAAVLYNCFTSIAVAREFTRRYLWPYLPFLGKRPEDKFADLVGKVILQVCIHSFFAVGLAFALLTLCTTDRLPQTFRYASIPFCC